METIKKVFQNLKKNWQLIFMCISISAASFYILRNHYLNRGKDDLLYKVESKILDMKLVNRGENKVPTKVGILAIDEASIEQFGRWPFSRRHYAKAFDNLKKLGVKWIGFDVVWAEPEKTLLEDAKKDLDVLSEGNIKQTKDKIHEMMQTSPSDKLFVESLKNFENIIQGFFYFSNQYELKINRREKFPFRGLDLMENSEIQLIEFPGDQTIDDYPALKKSGIVTNTELYSSATDHFAFFSNDADEDAINRWVTLVANINGKLMPSLSLKSAAEYLDREIFVMFSDVGVDTILLISREDEDDAIEIPIDPYGRGRILANHRGPSRAFHHFSLVDAANNNFTEEEKKNLKDSILLLGATATGINDIRPNPFDPAIDGVENHAAVIDNILTGNYLKRPMSQYYTERMIIICVGLFFTPLLIWGRASITGLAVIGALVGYYYVDKYLWFDKGLWTLMAVPVMQITSMFIITNIYKYINEEKDKKFLKEAFGSYISPELIDDMYNSGEPPKLGGTSGPLTAYFTDIQSFSSFSEQLTATQLVELLNEYLTAMTDILLDDKGTLDKYEGDAIIAFFGAPLSLPDHASKACYVAVKMQDTLLKLREKWVAEGNKWPQIVKDMRMRIGINSGEIVTGNMGSRDRMNYTMMGDSVNLAARLEEAAKQYGIFTQVSKFTKDMTNDEFIWRELDTIRVVGKTEPVTTFELLGIKGDTDQTLLNISTTFTEALSQYKEQKWDESLANFEKCLEFEYERFPELKGKKTNPSLIYIDRVKAFQKDPPPEDWDGVFTLTAK